MADIVIKHGTVVTMDPGRRVIADGALAIEGDSIVAVGKTQDIAASHNAALTIDATDRLVIPGLIDGHNHPFQYLSKGIGDDVDIMTWLYRRVYPFEAAVSAEEAYVGALGNFAQMIRSGTTCFNDPGGYHADSLAQAALDIGMRGIVNRSTRDLADDDVPIPEKHFEDTDTAVARSEALIDRWNGAADGRLRAWTSLRYIPNCSDDLCRRVKDLADRRGVGIHTHVAAVFGENELITEKFGKRSLERYHDLGLFGPNLYCVHMGYPNEREVGWLKQHDVKVAHCPSASMHGSYGVVHNRMMPAMAEAGITISLGTDSATAGRFLDMVRVMYLAACAHKDAYVDPLKMGAHKALEMATIDGARACLWDDQIGSIEVGKKADIVLVDMTGLHWAPTIDPVNTLVYAANGADVDTVIINGRVIMRDRTLLTVDLASLRRDIDAAAKAIWRRSDLSLAPRWPVA